MVLGFITCVALSPTFTGCSESSTSDQEEPDPSKGGASGSGDPCERIGADECEADDRCTLATTFDCEAWDDVSYCVSRDVDCESARSSRGVALYTNENVTEGQCYEFESLCYTGSFRAPEEAECEVCDF